MTTRILHFSDIHLPFEPGMITPRVFLRPKRILAVANYIVRRRAKFRDAPRKWDLFQRAFVIPCFDAILCTGDLTTMGLRSELAAAREKLAACLAHPGFILLPGNHDLYLPGSDADFFQEVFHDLLHRPDVLRADDRFPYPFIRLLNDDAAILAINSAKPNPVIWRSSGRVADDELDRVKTLLRRDELRGRRVIAATHYNPDSRDSARHGLENRRDLLDLLAEGPCDLLVHGHIHRGHSDPIEGFAPRVCCAGSLTYARRETFWSYEIRPDGIRAIPGRWNGKAYSLQPATLG